MSDSTDKDDADDGGRFPIEPETRSRPDDNRKSNRESEKHASDDD